MPEFETYDDGAFTVFSTRWGTYASKTPDGKGLCSGLDKDAVISTDTPTVGPENISMEVPTAGYLIQRKRAVIS